MNMLLAGLAALGLCAGAPSHRFVCTDYTQGKVFVVAENGQAEWSYDAPDANDIWLLPNGNLLFDTGHLVFATLHTTGAARTVDRIVDAFPTTQQSQIRTQLASGIVAIISQLLLVREDGPGRVAAFEILISTPAIQALIRESKTYRVTSEIQTGAKYGMITLDAYLMALYQAGKIAYEDLITKSQDPESVVLKLEETQRKRR